MKEEKGLKIVNLQAENIKKLTAIDITPNSSVVHITGQNGAGKSSVLDCIVMALKGGKEIPEEPITKGADKGKIKMDFGEFVVIRSFTKDNTYLKILNQDGSVVSSPQKFLDKIVGNISFDPLDFINKEKKKQLEIFLALIGADTSDLDRQEREVRDKRTSIGRDRDREEAFYRSLPEYPECKATEEKNITELTSRLTKAVNYNSALQKFIDANEKIKTDAMDDVSRIKELEEELKELKEKVSNAKQSYQSNKEILSTYSFKNTEGELEDEINGLSEINEKIRANKEKGNAKIKYTALQKEYDDMTRIIDGIIKQRNDILSRATIPVEGLSFNDKELLYNGIPVEQCSDGEKLMISLGISMALNPTMRVLRIKDGSLLDGKNRSIIENTVKDKDYQLWFESVGSESSVGIFIEEGEIVSVDGVKVKETKKVTTKKHEAEEVKNDSTKQTTPDEW